MIAQSGLSPDLSSSGNVSLSIEDRLSALSHRHLDILRNGSAISDAVIAARGYYTATTSAELSALGFAPYQCRVPALVLPVHTPDGQQPLCVLRPDYPRVHEDRSKGRLPDGTYPQKALKYEFPKGAAMRIDCPPPCRPRLGDPRTPLWITEGQKKADALASQGVCAIALMGVWNFKGRNEFGGTTLLADFDYIAWKDRDVYCAFDSDASTKRQMRAALDHLMQILRNKQARVTAVYLPGLEDGGSQAGKQGVDDYLASGHTIDDLRRCAGSPRSAPKPAPPLVEFLDEPPEVMSRLVALIDSRAYVATWLYAGVTETETIGRNGEIVRFEQPRVRKECRLVVVRDDGRRFSEDGASVEAKFADLGFEVHLSKVASETRLWTKAALNLYRAGRRTGAVKLLRKIVEVIDRFIDFDLSLADQVTMCELIACYVICTYFLPAFKVIGFLWANGDRGSGKSHLGDLVCELAYLGKSTAGVVTVAVLRDLADQGGMLSFDEAETLADPQRADPDKRALLLAGNRRDSQVPVKEPNGDQGWSIRWVNTFCPRLFTAIRQPDPVLASRSIVVPLIRTSERRRANADPLDHDLWPHDRRGLVDELWALALAHLREMPAYESQVNQRAFLTGRNLEPWRAPLAVALWLQELAAPGSRESDLFDRLNRLSVVYQAERATLEPPDLKTVTLRALQRLFDAGEPGAAVLNASATDIAGAIRQLVREDELEINDWEVTATRVGRILGQMRLQRDREGGTGARSWIVPRRVLDRALEAYGLLVPTDEPPVAPTQPSEVCVEP